MKKIITFGEVLLRLSTKNNLKFVQAPEFNVDFGGSELNVATTIVNFGINAEFVTRLPDNELGKSALMQIRKNNIATNNILFGGDRLGIYFLENGASVRGSKVVYDRLNSSFSIIQLGMINWKDVFKDATWFHWSGITAGVSQSAADVCLEAIKVAKEMGLTISTDFNYRANLWKYGKSPKEIMTEMISLCDIVLAGDYASEQYFDIKPIGNTKKELEHSLCHLLLERFPNVKKVAITSRENISASHNIWSAVLFDGTNRYDSKSYDITDIVDRIGAGDSFMGALIYGLNEYDDQKALDFAVAASCLKHTIYGDFNLVSKEEVESLMNGNQSGRVNR